MKGFVDYVNAERGFGFVYDTNKIQRYFFHVTNVAGCDFGSVMPLKAGNIVEFEPGMKLKGPVALNVTLIKFADDAAVKS
jgi:cold shock CspA family protein